MVDVNKEINRRSKLDTLGFLRGVAVIMVCFCHFAHALSSGHSLAVLFDYFYHIGALGVDVFFVISGFVIPFSLHAGKYVLQDYFRFLYKRLLRLHPPYLAALALTLVVMYLSYRARQLAFPETTTTILKSLAYLHIPMDNPVFWTLKVEAQYYIFIGLFYLALNRWPVISLFIGIPIILLLGETAVANYLSLFKFIVPFILGTVGFRLYLKIGNQLHNWLALGLVLCFSAFFYRLPVFVITSITMFFILFYRRSIPGWLQFPGKISYSIYLIHFIIGIKFINLVKPKIDPAYSWLLLIGTIVIVMFLSWLFYKIFEDYSEKLSKKIKYSAATLKMVEKKPDEDIISVKA